MRDITLNLSQFAIGLGNTDRLTLEASMPFHKAYVKADGESQAAMKLEFVIGYVQGNLKVTAEKAAKIVALKRVERKAGDEKAVNAAAAKFRYHVSRDESSSSKEQDLLANALRAFGKLNAAQKRKFLASV
jgi:hypothetical protein